MLITSKHFNSSTLKNASFMFLLLKMCLIFGHKKEVLTDLGHGGNDSSAIGINFLKEKDVVLNISKEVLNLSLLLKQSYLVGIGSLEFDSRFLGQKTISYKPGY